MVKPWVMVGDPARFLELTMFEREYSRKPSFVQLNCAFRDARAAGADFVQLTWGENQITLQRGPYGWEGHGWVGKVGGHDMAEKINRGGATK